MPVVTCAAQGCTKLLPHDRHHMRKYCGDVCRKRMAARRYKFRAGTGKADPRDEVFTYNGNATARRGPRYKQFVAEGWPKILISGAKTQKEVVKELGTTSSNVSRWMAAYFEDHPKVRRSWGPDPEDKEAVEGGLIDFRQRFYPKKLIPDFQVEWANLLEETIDDCGRTLLLAPQRFGKSELLIDMCIKLIIERPNISIGWISKTADLAETMVRYIRMELESNDDLIERSLGPGKSFVPHNRSGNPWTNTKFTVDTRTYNRKAATMEALGVGGTVVGRDFDVIVIDDMQDRARAMSASRRDKDAEWFFTDLNSRKEENTALFFICSRQHEDDVPGRIMADHADDWRVRVYQAHDPACPIDEREVSKHEHCILWPEKRTFKWLMAQKRANPDHFARNYQNNPATDQMQYVKASDIEMRKSDRYPAGENPGGKLVCGIDPASSKPTAATLWAYKDGKRYLVDALMAKPGNEGVKEIITTFRQTYGCSTYIVETNGYQGQILQDTGVKEMARVLRCNIKPHYSSRVNKWDTSAGVVAMLHRVADEEGGVVLPMGGDERVQERLEMVYRQWLTYDADMNGHKAAKDDLVMASWFPQLEMDRFSAHYQSQVVYLEDRTNYGGTSYGSLTAYARSN